MKFKYQVIKNAVSFELANFIFNYFLLKRDAVNFMYNNDIIYDNGMFGTWSDKQVPNTYSHYADMVMETLLMKVLPKMQKETGLQLIPTYSYARLYKHGDILARHKDRRSCAISATLNLGGDPWPIYLNTTKNRAQDGFKVDLTPGDLLIYSGDKMEHWREEFEGDVSGQAFLHYNEFGSKNKYDGRPMLGLPSEFRKQ